MTQEPAPLHQPREVSFPAQAPTLQRGRGPTPPLPPSMFKDTWRRKGREAKEATCMNALSLSSSCPFSDSWLLKLQGQRQMRISRPSARPPGNPASRIPCLSFLVSWVPGPPWTVPWPRKSREGSHSTSQSHVPHGGEVVSPQRDQDTVSSLHTAQSLSSLWWWLLSLKPWIRRFTTYEAFHLHDLFPASRLFATAAIFPALRRRKPRLREVT